MLRRMISMPWLWKHSVFQLKSLQMINFTLSRHYIQFLVIRGQLMNKKAKCKNTRIPISNISKCNTMPTIMIILKPVICCWLMLLLLNISISPPEKALCNEQWFNCMFRCATWSCEGYYCKSKWYIVTLIFPRY